MIRAQNVWPALAALLLGCCLTSCETTIPGCPFLSGPHEETQGEPRAANILTADQVARQFFDAYKRHDRAAAAKVASPKAINKLVWDAKAGRNTTLELQETDKGDWVILYEGGFIELIILGDGHVGSSVVDVKMHAD